MSMLVFLFVLTLISSTFNRRVPFSFNYYEYGTRLCFCANNDQCREGTGSCPRGCLPTKFGPGCQFDFVKIWADSAAWLNDSDWGTCNRGDVTTFSLRLSKRYSPTYWRIVFSLTAAEKLNFKLQYVFDDSRVKTCKPDLMLVNERVVDVYCPSPEPIYNITIAGPALRELCEIYLSAGQNVANMYDNGFNQSSIIAGFGPRNAVDGHFNDGTKKLNMADGCILTNKDATGPGPYWKITLHEEQDVSSIKIVNRRGHFADLMKGFAVTIFNSSQKIIYEFRDNSTAGAVEYFIVPTTTLKNTRIVLVSLPQKRRILALCEVFINAALCPSRKYGNQCGTRCGECVDDLCDPIQGFCAEGCRQPGYTACPQGTYGVDCTSVCRQTCTGGLCHHEEGTCDSCLAGYRGKFCDQACPMGSYGLNCSRTCELGCPSCNATDGICTGDCLPGYTGTFCEKVCPKGMFGQNCSSQCGACADTVCDPVKGKCLHGCEPGYHGPQCLLKAQTQVETNSIKLVIVLALIILCAAISMAVLATCKNKNSAALDTSEWENKESYEPSNAGEEDEKLVEEVSKEISEERKSEVDQDKEEKFDGET